MFVFLHVPKTGGSSISRSVTTTSAPIYEPHAIRNANLWEELPSPEMVAVLPFLSGHIPMGIENWLRDHGFNVEVEYTTMLRDPVDRLLSSYRFQLRQGEKPPPFDQWALDADNKDADNFLTRFFCSASWPIEVPNGHWLKPHRIDSDHFAAARAKLHRCAFIGHFANYRTDAERLVKIMGGDGLRFHTNSTSHIEAVPNPSTLAVLRERNRWDYELLASVSRSAEP